MLLISGIPKMSNLNKCELNIDQVYTEVLHFSLVKMVKTLEGPKQQEKNKMFDTFISCTETNHNLNTTTHIAITYLLPFV